MNPNSEQSVYPSDVYEVPDAKPWWYCTAWSDYIGTGFRLGPLSVGLFRWSNKAPISFEVHVLNSPIVRIWRYEK